LLSYLVHTVFIPFVKLLCYTICVLHICVHSCFVDLSLLHHFYKVWTCGFTMAGTCFFCGSLLLAMCWQVFRSHRLKCKHAHPLLICVFLSLVTIMYWCISCTQSAMIVHRTCGALSIFWRIMLPYLSLHMRAGVLCIILLTLVELRTTAYVLEQFGHGAETTRVLSILVGGSCCALPWCCFIASMWKTLWLTQLELAAEKEASKSLLSMVCDATFWLSRDGDTILKSTKQFDAILGQHAEQSHLSQHMPDSEVSRLDTALSGRCLASLPTSILRDGIATNVDLFIVPSMPLSGKVKQFADCLESFGTLVGLRVLQPFVDCSEAQGTKVLPSKLHASFNQSRGILEDGVRRRRRVTFSVCLQCLCIVKITPVSEIPTW
jgi:hypothetical protein